MRDSLFSFQNVSYTYPDKTKALTEITLSVSKHKKVALLGHNGSGKSTLLLHLNGIHKPTNGIFAYKGTPLSYTKKSLKQLRGQVGIVFQDPDTQLFSANVYQDIAFGALNVFQTLEQAKPYIDRAIEMTDLEELLHKPTHFLSYGQKKRVAVAGVLAMNPEVVVLDEPTAGLDPYYVGIMKQLLKRIAEEEKTIILSTHDLAFAYEWADEGIVMHQGKVCAHEAITDLFFNEDMLTRTHLEKPWVIEVYEQLIQTGMMASKPVPKTKEQLFEWIAKGGNGHVR